MKTKSECTLSLNYIRSFDEPWAEFINQVNACGFPLRNDNRGSFAFPPGTAEKNLFHEACRRLEMDNWSVDVNEADGTITVRWWKE